MDIETATRDRFRDGEEQMPVIATWFEAKAFCAWDGGWLPTELEWSFAASGGSEQRLYPWSNPAASPTVDRSFAVYNASTTATVGSVSPRGDGRWGHADLGGNVHEWLLDSSGQLETGECIDCADLRDFADDCGTKGGNWMSATTDLRSANVVVDIFCEKGGTAGFRCARPADK